MTPFFLGSPGAQGDGSAPLACVLMPHPLPLRGCTRVLSGLPLPAWGRVGSSDPWEWPGAGLPMQEPVKQPHWILQGFRAWEEVVLRPSPYPVDCGPSRCGAAGSYGWGGGGKERQRSRPNLLFSNCIPARPGASWLACKMALRPTTLSTVWVGGLDLNPPRSLSSYLGLPPSPITRRDPGSGFGAPRADFAVACASPRWSPMPPSPRSRIFSLRAVSSGPSHTVPCDPSRLRLWVGSLL